MEPYASDEALKNRGDTGERPAWEDIRAGNLSVMLATRPQEIEAAQALRYRIFYGEMGGDPSEEVRGLQRDFDVFDAYCDHLLVIDNDLPPGPAQVVGTYRMLRSSAMRKLGRFYSEGEFNIDLIRDSAGETLEVGRSCVDANYRSRAVIQLLWRGIGAYVTRHDIQLIFGCASFLGKDVSTHRLALSYLHHYHLAPPALRITALPDQYVNMDLMPKEAVDRKEGWASLPALIKGYLRVGGYVGHGAVIDPHCNTVDVGIVVKTDLVADKYAQRYAPYGKNDE